MENQQACIGESCVTITEYCIAKKSFGYTSRELSGLKLEEDFSFSFCSLDKRSPEVIDVQSNYSVTPPASLISLEYYASFLKCLTLILKSIN